MNELKTVVKHVVCVQRDDLVKFVEECYGGSWSFDDPAMGLYETDTFVVYEVDGSVDEQSLDHWNEWVSDPRYSGSPHPLLILNDLARRGLIVKGEYLIEDRLSGSDSR